MRREETEAARYFMLKTLAQDDAFSDVPAGLLQALVDRADVVELRKGDVVYESGEPWPKLGFVVDGSIAMAAHGADGKDHLYETADAGEFFGVSAMFDGGPAMARTVVVSPHGRLATVERDIVVALCKEHGPLAMAFAKTLAHRVRRTTSLLADQVNLTAQQRIARYLLTFTSEPGLAQAKDPLPTMTQAQIGAAAGTVKDVAARTIGLFEKHGALKRQRGHVQWLHRERLTELAGL